MTMPEHIKNRVAELFCTQKLGVVATHNHGQPYTSLMAFAASEDLRYIYFVTRAESRKFNNISQDARIALLVDNRSNQVTDFEEALAVTVTGTVHTLDKNDVSARVFLNKHPYLHDFLHDPQGMFLGMCIKTLYIVSQFESVIEVNVD